MTNRLLLLILTGLGGLSVLLCLLVLWRESSNGSRIDELRGDLRAAHEGQEKQHKELLGELQKTRSDLAIVSKKLDQTDRSLQTTRGELAGARQALAGYKAKPWLNRPGKEEPWKDDVQVLTKRLAELEKQVLKIKPPQDGTE